MLSLLIAPIGLFFAVFWVFLKSMGLPMALAGAFTGPIDLRGAGLWIKGFLAVTAIGIGIIYFGMWSVNGETSQTPSYAHGLICVYGAVAAMLTAFVGGQVLRGGVDCARSVYGRQ